LTHLRSLQVRDSGLVFRSKPMTQIIELAMKMADVDSTLLITGESGTGKELVAKLVHRQGKGDASPFISINCAAIPEQLLESELFGYEGGAFTGARKEGNPGLFELAHNGTLFLYEVAELPLSLQVKLLRAIQDKEVTRVGSTKAIPVNVRIIAATNRNLPRMLREGTFREDLYYRLMVVPLHVLPLRDRREDIPLLVRNFLDEFNSHFGYEKTLLPEVLDKLVNYSWPGNVRELKNVIERMIVMSPGNEIGLSSIPESIYTRRHVPRHGTRLKDAVEETERYLIEEVYKEHHSWNKVAEVLGMDRSTIFRKAQKYHLAKQ
jgi:transcriptional regulator with PAS, ATPase and Fis domain